MQKTIDLARKISDEPENKWENVIKENNLTEVFAPIYSLKIPLRSKNLIAAFLVFAYDPDSKKINIQRDRHDDKVSILNSIELNPEDKTVAEILANENNEFNNSVALYLQEILDWRWITLYSLLDYHSRMIRFVNQKTDEEKSVDKKNKEGEVKTTISSYDITEIAKVNIQKSELLEKAIEAREKANVLLDQIRKDFMVTDHAVQQDFNFSYSDSATKKVDMELWRNWIKYEVKPKRDKANLNR